MATIQKFTTSGSAVGRSVAVNDTTAGFTISQSGSAPVLALPTVPAAASFAVVSAGNGPFDGTSAGKFSGASGGTIFGINNQSGYAGNLADWQIAGSSKFRVDAAGNLTIAGTLQTGAGALLTNPMTTVGDFIVGGANGAPARLPVGQDGQLLAVSGGSPAWTSSINLPGTLAAGVLNLSTTPGAVQVSGTTVLQHYTDRAFLLAAPTAVTTYGRLSLGGGPFDGTAAGHFVGNGSGTVIAANATTGFTGNLLDLQVAGTSQLSVASWAVVITPPTTHNGSVTINGADFSSVFTIQNTTAGSSRSPNIVFRDNQASPQRIILRKEGTALQVIDTGGLAQIYLDTASVAQFNQGVKVVVPSAATTTLLTANAPSGYSGLLADFQLGSTSRTKITASGELSTKGIAAAIVNKTSAYTLTTSDSTVTCDASGGAFAITLPAANTVLAGRQFTIKKVDGGSNAVTIAKSGSDTIDGASAYLLATKNQVVTLASDGVSKWWVLNLPGSFRPQQYGGTNAAAINAACADAALVGGTVYLGPGVYTADAAITTPSNVTIAIESGALITINASIVVTVGGKILAAPRRIFAGSGTVVLTDGCADKAYAEWWGAVCNATSVADGATTAGSAVITSTTANWTNADVGKTLRGYNPAGQALVIGSGVVIASVQSPTQCTLNTSVATSAAGLVLSWGTDASSAINSAIKSSAYVCPVQLLSGTYYCANNLQIVSGTMLRGLGREVTKLMGQTWQGFFIDINAQPIQDFELRGFTVLQVGTGSLQLGVHMSGNGAGGQTAASVSNGVLDDIHVDGGTVGFFIGDGSHDISCSNLKATNQQMYGGIYGKGYWVSNGCYNISWDNPEVVNNAGDGFCIDAGHQVSSTNFNIVVNGLIATGFGGNGVLLEGATRCVVTDFVLNGGTPTTSSNGVFLQEDQKAIPTDYCEIGPGIIENVGVNALFLAGARYNHIHDINVHNLGLFSSGTAVNLASFTGQDAGLTAHDTSDNSIINVKVTQDAGVGTYSQAVAYNETTTNIQRNHCRGCEWGAPNQMIYNPGGSPVTGSNANTIDNLDVDSVADPFGVYFGTQRDTRLYRNSANSLRTPANFTADGLLTVSGGFATTTTRVSGPHSISTAESTILADTTAGSFNVTLPLAAVVGNGRQYVVKNLGSGVVTVVTSGGNLVDGTTSYALRGQYASLTLQSDGSNWWII